MTPRDWALVALAMLDVGLMILVIILLYRLVTLLLRREKP